MNSSIPSKIYMITNPDGLFEFAGIADPEMKKKIATYVGLIGAHSSSISMFEGEDIDEIADEVREHSKGVAANFNALGKILESYDIRLSFIPTVQMMFFIQYPMDVENMTPIDSIEAFYKAKENKAFVPLTAGIINDFLLAGESPDDEEDDSDDDDDENENPYDLFNFER